MDKSDDEYLKSNKIRRARERFPQLDPLVISKIRKEEIERAVDLRDQLPIICSAPKVLAKFVSGSYDFPEAYDGAVRVGGESVHLKTIKKFRDWITRPRVEEHLVEYNGKLRGSIVFELRKIESRVKHLLKKLE